MVECGVIANRFLSQYPAGSPDRVAAMVVSLRPTFVPIGIILDLAIAAFFVVAFYRICCSDRLLSIGAILSNLPWLLLKPIVVGFLWSLLFLIFPRLGDSWFTLVVASLILVSTYDVKFRDRRSERLRLSDSPTS